MSRGKFNQIPGTLRVALVHDYLKEIGGAERVLMALMEIFPQAVVYTAYKFPKYWGGFGELLSAWKIKESWGKWLPFLPKFLSYYTIISPWFFSSMDLSDYDLVIVSATGGYFPNGVRIGSKTKLVTYCHTPPRFLYGYPTATSERNKWYWKPISEIANLVLRQVDFRLAQRPHLLIANSKNVARRIWKFYRRDAEVVYPPVQIPNPKSQIPSKFQKVKTKRDYYLIVSRIVGGKNIELAIEAAEKVGFELRVVGRPVGRSGNEILGKIDNSKSDRIKYLGEVSEEEKCKLMANAKALLALSADEDLGITPIEAQMCGTAVIAYRGGGYLETVMEGKTGVFFDELTTDSLIGAIKRFDELIHRSITAENCMENAKRFDKENFQKRMLELITKYAGVA